MPVGKKKGKGTASQKSACVLSPLFLGIYLLQAGILGEVSGEGLGRIFISSAVCPVGKDPGLHLCISDRAGP